MNPDPNLHRAQLGLGDMDTEDFRLAAHGVVERIASYLEKLESYRVLPQLTPGQIRRQLPTTPPRSPEPLAVILDDYAGMIEPNITHWQHPGFLAYFSSVASCPGILGEMLAASLNSNVMFWRNAPASTELEEVVVSWLRQMVGLPDSFDGMFTDTASVSSLLSVVAARHVVHGLESRERGLSGRSDAPPLVMYCSAEAHSSIDKAAIVAGIGRQNVRRVATDDRFRMRADLLDDAIRLDRDSERQPFCVVATLGTTSSTSIDPIAPIIEVCEKHELWLHIDAAYGGAMALDPEQRGLFAGWERADSIVINPHKWMFTPFDASLLLFRRPEAFRDAFSLVPEYLRTRAGKGAHDYHEYGIQLGRRFRALKMWILIRYFGAEGMAARVRHHCHLAREFAGWIDAAPDWERLAPVPMATVCFRYRPHGTPEKDVDRINEQILERVNQSGRIYLSHTRLRDHYAIRVAVGNPRTEQRHLELCWELLREATRAST
ncbi:MAG: amino acid decarboxylase [Acidobacteriota bacterium]|nr:MAG: amino acid decarboxylase [Acidobacteriota bacterium]